MAGLDPTQAVLAAPIRMWADRQWTGELITEMQEAWRKQMGTM